MKPSLMPVSLVTPDILSARRRQSKECLRAFHDLTILTELGGAGEIHRQDDLHTELLGL